MTLNTSDKVSNRWLVLVLLISIYLLDAADRQLMAVLAEPMRRDLGLSDGQLGMLTGFLFAVPNFLFGIPLARIADRMNRIWMIASSCLIWSLCTGAMGTVSSFGQLVLARVGLAASQSGVSAGSYSLISDYFPPARRATIFGLFAVGFPLGAAVGTAAGAWIAARYGWRSAFLLMVIPGIILSGALRLFVRHPQRGRLDDPTRAPSPPPPLMTVLRDIVRRPVIWRATLAASLSGLPTVALITWAPAFLMRVKGMPMLDISQIYSLFAGVTMCTGMIAGGWMADRAARRTRRAAALIPAFAYLICPPFVLAALWAPSWHYSLVFLFVPFLLMSSYFAPMSAIIQNETAPEARAITAMVCITLGGVVGSGAGPALVGGFSELLKPAKGDLSLQWALAAIVPFFFISALAHFATAAALPKGQPVAPSAG